MTRKALWDSVYRSKVDAELSWTQAEPRLSLSLIRSACPSGKVIDVGGGSSVLVDRLLDDGYSVAVLDVSPAGIERARKRLGKRAGEVQWLIEDVTTAGDLGTFDVWHDRAVFHFLTEAGDRAAYVETILRTISVGGHVVIATFALEGPSRCSGLPVRRYDTKSLKRELGSSFGLLQSVPEMHTTPRGKPQSFQYSLLRRIR